MHLEQNQLPDALSCFDEAFLALANDNSRGADVREQATISAQYKIAVTLLQVLLLLFKILKLKTELKFTQSQSPYFRYNYYYYYSNHLLH